MWREIFFYVCAHLSYNFEKKYRSPVTVAKHCIFDLRMMGALSDYGDQTATEDKLIARTYML